MMRNLLAKLFGSSPAAPRPVWLVDRCGVVYLPRREVVLRAKR